MPLLQSSSGTSVSLEDDEKYVGTLVEFEDVEGTAYGDPSRKITQLKIVLQVGDDPEATKWVYLNHTVGKAQGRVSKLRQVLNAFAGKPEETVLSYHTDEHYWTYPETGERFDLREGLRLSFMGSNYIADDGSERFRIEKYRPATAAKRSAEKPAPAADDIPF